MQTLLVGCPLRITKVTHLTCRTKLEEQGEREKIRAAVRNMGDVVYKPMA